MQVTPELLAPYLGGQMEIQPHNKNYLYCGKIETIAIENDELRTRFEWLAKGEKHPSPPVRWIKENLNNHTASLDTYSVSNILNGCLALYLPFAGDAGETIILHPPDGNQVDSAEVEGLTAQ